MNRRAVVIIVFLALGYMTPAAELYNLDFEPPEIGTYTNVFGGPTVQSSIGSMTNALVFRAVTSYDQISLPVRISAPVYELKCDILTHNLRNSQYMFGIFLDLTPLPSGRSIYFHGGFNMVSMTDRANISTVTDDKVIHVEMVLNFPANLLSLTLDQTVHVTTKIDAYRLSSIRFSMNPWIGGAVNGPGTYAAIDNIIVSATPVTLVAATGLTNRLFGFAVVGPPASSVVAESSDDLVNWQPLWTNAFTGALNFSDPESTINSRRFYRVHSP